MNALGLTEKAKIVSASEERESKEADLRTILSAPDLPEAIFCWSDLHAVSLLNVAKTMGIRVPEDVAIVGYDNSSVAALPLVDLSSVDQSGWKLGTVAAEILLSRIGGRTRAQHILLNPTLIRRSSF